VNLFCLEEVMRNSFARGVDSKRPHPVASLSHKNTGWFDFAPKIRRSAHHDNVNMLRSAKLLRDLNSSMPTLERSFPAWSGTESVLQCAT